MATYDAEVTVHNLSTDVGPVPADSLVLLATLGAAQGHRLRVEATGADAQAAVDGVRALAETGFGDEA